jgi:hypothetical protein
VYDRLLLKEEVAGQFLNMTEKEFHNRELE